LFPTLVYTETMTDTPKPPDSSADDKPKVRKEIPVFAVQDDDAVMAEEMADLFEEDKVSHQHGSSEPEAD
jgi:hypothetical protein